MKMISVTRQWMTEGKENSPPHLLGGLQAPDQVRVHLLNPAQLLRGSGQLGLGGRVLHARQPHVALHLLRPRHVGALQPATTTRE